MSLKITNTFTRPSTDVAFHISNVADTFITHVLDTYKNTGKLLDIATDVSADGKVLTTNWTWADQAAYDEYFADPQVVAFLANRDAHNSANGIVATRTTATV
jgi:hypothetical protein